MADTFLDWVQRHERAWGDATYPERPTLEQILKASVVTFWRPLKEEKQPRYKIKVFESTRDIERYMTKLLFRASVNPPTESLARVYVNQRQVAVKAVRILFEEIEPQPPIN